MFERFFLKIFTAVLLINCLAVSPVQAKIETVSGTGEYIMSMKETPEFAQQNAKLYAERAAIEQAGIFIASVSISKNFQLQDEITTFAAGLLKNINVVENKMLPLTGEAAGYIKVVVTVEAQVDTDDFETALNKWQNKDSNEKSNLVERDRSQQELIEKQAQRIKDLEDKLANIKTEQDRQNVQQEIKEIDKNALYIQKIDEGWKFRHEKNFSKALELFNEAVELNPNDYRGYDGRGTVYDDLNKYGQALNDLNKAVELNTKSFEAYNNRGAIYSNLKEYDKAIADYNKAIELNQNYYWAYSNRGDVYRKLKQYDKAISDHNKAIELDSNYYYAYNNRGLTYLDLQQYDKAISDFNKAIELDKDHYNQRQNRYWIYNNRGITYKNLKQYKKAIADFTKCIEINSKFMWAYVNRAKCYQELGENKKANADFAKAQELGYKG